MFSLLDCFLRLISKCLYLFVGQVMSPHQSDPMSQWSQVSRIVLWRCFFLLVRWAMSHLENYGNISLSLTRASHQPPLWAAPISDLSTLEPDSQARPLFSPHGHLPHAPAASMSGSAARVFLRWSCQSVAPETLAALFYLQIGHGWQNLPREGRGLVESASCWSGVEF